MTPLRILRYVAFALGGIAALLIAAAVFIVATFDAVRVKAEIIEIVEEKKQRTLEIEGEIEISFWPSLGIKLGKASLSEHASGQEFATLEAAQLSLAVLPLLEKRVVIDKLVLDGVKATLVRHKDGTFNIDDLLANQTQDSETLRFDIAGVKVTDSRVDFYDEKLGRRFSARGFDLATGRLGNAAEGKLAFDGKLEVDQPAAAFDIAMSGDYRYDADQARYAVFDVDSSLNGTVADVEALALRLSAGALQLKHPVGEIEIERLDLTAGGKRGEEDFEVEIDAPMLVLKSDRAIGQTATLGLKLGAARHRLDARIALAGLEGSTKALKIGNVKIRLDATHTRTRIRGGLNTSLAADLGARTLDLARFSGAFNVANPDLPMKSVDLPVNGRLHVNVAQQAASGDVSAKFDDTHIRAQWSAPKFAPLAVGFDVEVDRINIDRYFPPRPQEPEQPDQPIDLSVLEGLNADGTLKIGALQLSNVKAQNIRLEIRAKDGRLEVDPMAASLYDGTLAGKLAIDAEKNRMALSQRLSGVSVSALLKDLADRDFIAGQGEVVFDLVGAWTTAGALKRSLAGTARVALEDGAINGIDLIESARASKTHAALDKPAAPRTRGASKTDFSKLSASFRIAKGVARTDDFVATSPLLRLGGKGSIDFAEGSMDYTATANVVGGATGQAGTDRANPRRITVPVRISGQLDEPIYEVAEAARPSATAKAR